MGGDHKCPVCQATFTRPQHVARHMRSHTGDRPYKCQYCGDQFARSDLLSRHVNKCHANEKPLPGSTNGRRKGTTSLSRATTSKQACDQCVQGSLPCDGSNPCAKCVQRKYRCTYVKFHRQTAPVGPGHNPAPPLATSSSSTFGSTSDPHHHPHHPSSSSSVLGLPNVPNVNIALGHGSHHGVDMASLGVGVGGLTGGGGPGVRFPTSTAGMYASSASPVDDFYHLPPPNGYTTTTSTSGAPGDLYSPAYTTSSRGLTGAGAPGAGAAAGLEDDLYGSMNRPGTGSSAGSSSASGHSVVGQWGRSMYGGGQGGEPRALHGVNVPPSVPPGQYGQGIPQPQPWSSRSAGYDGHQQAGSSHSHSHSQSHSGSHGTHAQGGQGSHAGGQGGGQGGGGGGAGGYTHAHAHAHAPPHDLEDQDLNANAQTFRDLFSDDFGPALNVPHATTGSPLLGPGRGLGPSDGGVSDGGSSDGGHSVGSGQSKANFRRRGLELNKAGEPYAFQYGQRRARAGSTASSSSRPSTHGYDSIAASPLITTQPLAAGQSQPGSATNSHFSNAFGSLTLDDANALAALGVGAGDGRSMNLSQNDPDATPLAMPFDNQDSLLLGGGRTSATTSSTSSNSASTATTSASNTGLRGFSPIQRPLSSLAAYPPSTYLNQTWQQGAAQQAAMGGVADDNLFAWGAGSNPMFSGTGWTPGGLFADLNFAIEGTTSDGSNPSGTGATPGALGLNPALLALGTGLTPTPGKEMDAKEMKEFWKMYMRTPLTGPAYDASGASNPDANSSTPSVPGGSNTPASSNPNNLTVPLSTPYRRPRVVSMPSSNSTPKVYRDGAVAHLHHLQAHLNQQKGLGPMSSLRTTLQGPLGGDGHGNDGNQRDMQGHSEDLSSYGAAVLARKAPVNLSLARALGRMKKQQAQVQVQQKIRGPLTSLIPLNQPGYSTDDSMSPTVSSRASSVGVGGDGDVRMVDGGAHVVQPRPSVKRLASSVLESDVVKVGRFDEGSEDITPKASDAKTSNNDTSTALVAPKPSVPFALLQVPADGDGALRKSVSAQPAMFPPPAILGSNTADDSSSSSLMPPPPGVPSGLGLGGQNVSRPPSLLERRTGRNSAAALEPTGLQ